MALGRTLAKKIVRRLARAPGLRSALAGISRLASPPVGKIAMGDLARDTPVSFDFGFDRGTPIDRLFIEQFLATHAGDIRGHALEIGDASYCKRFGSGVTQQDVLHVHSSNPLATIVGDISQPGVLLPETFDCMVLTQTLHLIYDLDRAVQAIHRALRPGGVALVTVPGVSSVERGEWGTDWFWSLTGQSARRLFEAHFGEGSVEVVVRGNVFAATCFLQGIAVEDAPSELLERDDPAYPVIVGIRAQRDA